MSYFEVRNVEIKGISACVPKLKDEIENIYYWGNPDDFIVSTGIKERRRADCSTTSADLCFFAAEKLIKDLNWNPQDIDALIFVSQTPDFILPSTSPLLQHKLGIPDSCFSLDISLGCSGWVYGLSVIASLMQSGFLRKGLLLAGDTITKVCSPDDKSTFPLFGDAGSATSIEYVSNSEGINFLMNSDGKGSEVIKIKDGGFRFPFSTSSLLIRDIDTGIKRKDIDLSLDGMDVFSFGITKVPKSVKKLLERIDKKVDEIDIFTFHQANKMMNETIRKKLKIEESKYAYSIEEFANTSCASIPLTLVTSKAEDLRNKKIKNLVCGYGVGLSWASAYFETNKIIVPELIEI